MIDSLAIRDAVPSDEDFIYHSWLNHYQANSYFAKRIPKKTFMKFHSLVANNAMNRAGIVKKIAGDNEFTIYGYVIAESVNDSPIIHYIYVRPEYQRLGIGLALINSLYIEKEFEVSHWVPILNEISRKMNAFTYNPYRM